MKNQFSKILCLCIALLTLLSAVACQNKKDDHKAEPTAETVVASTDGAPAVPSSTPDETAVKTSEPISKTAPLPATQPATVADTAALLNSDHSDPNNIYDASGFVSVTDVIPDAKLEIRYSTSHNFVGDPINGYEEPLAILTKEAAAALIGASNDLREQGYLIKIYDAYRPQRAVDHFVSWANDWDDTRMKSEFYPDLDKSSLFSNGYIAYSSGHSRGSTVDLTLVDAATGEDIDMGGSFDYFGTLSHPDYTGISQEQYNNRMILREAMLNNGFSPLSTEWWHFSLNGEPYPYTYFDFPVSSSSLKQ